MAILQGQDNPEKNAIVTDMLEKLTVEAKFVLYTIFNTPGELSALLFGNTPSESTEPINWIIRKKMNRDRIRHYMQILGWNTPTINRTIFQIKEFARELAKL